MRRDASLRARAEAAATAREEPRIARAYRRTFGS